MIRLFLIKYCLFCLLTLPLAQTYFVDPQYKLIEWKGWGTNMAWFGDLAGGFDQSVQDEITYSLFSPEKLNLNILRYVIGGTTPGDTSCGTFLLGAATESFRDGPDKPFIWSRDSHARKILLTAKQLGVDTFEAFSMSPPSWLTKSGCSNGNKDGALLHDNFHPENASTFADYLTEVVKHYHEQYNISFTSLAPVYEPSSGAFDGTRDREGCNMQLSTVAEIIKSAHASLEYKNLTFCRLSVASENTINEELETQQFLYGTGVSKLYHKVNTNDYSNDGQEKRSALSTLAARNGHDLWMSSLVLRKSTLQDMTQGINIATRLILDLRNMLPSAWVYCDIVADSISPYGVLEIPFSNATVENIQYNSGYYVLMQFTKFIKKGFTLVHINDQDSIAAYDAASKTLVIVTLNAKSNLTTKMFDLGAFSSLGQIHTIRTSRVEPHVVIPPPVLNEEAQFSFQFPARSVTTFQITGAGYEQTDNLIRNGNFEWGGTNPWLLLHGSRDDNGINGKHVRQGELSGFLDLNESNLSLMQNVTVSFTKTYRLSGWCATSGVDKTKYGILVNGAQGPEVTIDSTSGDYRIYGLAIEAQASDLLTIYIQSEKGNHTAQVDDVALY